LLIEALDELVDGTKGAAFPLIRADLHLSYTQVGLLIAVPLLAGGLIELPLGILAGYGARRNQLVLVGGILFGASLCVVAFAGSFGVLLAGLIAFFPASGAFVGLTQAALIDADLPPEQPPQAGQPEAGQPEAGQPEARQPEGRQPEAGQPDGGRRGCEAGQPDGGRRGREAGQPEGGRRGREAVQEQRMAAWNLAGSTGAVAGPILLAVVLTVGGSWRSAYLLLAGVTGVALAVAAVAGPARRASRSAEPPGGDDPQPAVEGGGGGEGGGGEGGGGGDGGRDDGGRGGSGGGDGGRGGGGGDSGGGDSGSGRDDGGRDGEDDDKRPGLREALAAVRDGDVARWLILLEVTDLLLDVLTGYVGIYLVDVVHASPADAALGVAVRLGAGLGGDALFVVASRRISGRVALTISAGAAAVLYPAFLLVPWFGAKLAVLAALSIFTACWYPVVQAGLYGSLPGRSGIAVSWSSAASMVGAVGPLLVGVVAQRAGLTWALSGLVVVPIAVLLIAPHRGQRRSRSVMR
jgi:predicted MFS family arabinose efflux permease